MKSYSLFISGMLVLLAACNQLSSTNLSEDEQAIRLRRDISNRAIASHDTTTMASVWTEDYHIVSSGNKEVSGRNFNRVSMAERFATSPDITFIRSTETIQTYAPWNMAAETGRWIGYWTENGKRIDVGGSYYAKWHKLEGKWYIRAEVFTLLKCKGGEYCEKGPI